MATPKRKKTAKKKTKKAAKGTKLTKTTKPKGKKSVTKLKKGKKPVAKVKLKKGEKPVAKVKATRPPPHSGQSDFAIKALVPNKNERLVAKTIKKMRTAMLSGIAKQAFPSLFKKKGKKAESWVRNALRRLVRARWVKKVERGVYEITKHGAHELQAVKETAWRKWAVPVEPRPQKDRLAGKKARVAKRLKKSKVVLKKAPVAAPVKKRKVVLKKAPVAAPAPETVAKPKIKLRKAPKPEVPVEAAA